MDKTERTFVTVLIVIVVLGCLGGGASVFAGAAWALHASETVLSTLAAGDS